MKPGDIRMVFGNPIKCTNPIGQAKLQTKSSETETIEIWWVEFLDQPDHIYEAILKKDTDGENKQNKDSGT